jgi:membrane protein
VRINADAWSARAQGAIDFLRYLWRQLLADRCQESAAALTYLTLFAVVPLLTVSFLILSAIPEFRSLQGRLENLIFQYLLPATGAEVRDYLLQFANQARRLSVAGILILIASAYLMLKNIEKTFNRIWRTGEHRRGLSSFLLYWAILSLGPILLGVGAVVSTCLSSLSLLADIGVAAEIRSNLLRLLPLGLSTAAFTLLFAAVPNCRVNIRHAALGGLLTAVLFELGKIVFAKAVSLSSYEVIYGTFAAIPLFLLWIYLSWLLILGGAEFVRALSSFRRAGTARMPELLVALAVLERFYRAQQDGDVLRESQLLHGRWLPGGEALGIDTWEPLRNAFLQSRLLRATENREFLLGRSLDRVPLAELYRLLSAPGMAARPFAERTPSGERPSWAERAEQLVTDAESDLRTALDVPLAELFAVGETRA